MWVTDLHGIHKLSPLSPQLSSLQVEPVHELYAPHLLLLGELQGVLQDNGTALSAEPAVSLDHKGHRRVQRSCNSSTTGTYREVLPDSFVRPRDKLVCLRQQGL